MMNEIELTESQLLDVITDPKLFFGIGQIDPNQRNDVLRFLATYILISQLLFLRFFSSGNPQIMQDFKKPIKNELQRIFKKIYDTNYRPIFEVNVLHLIPDSFIEDAFDLIWGLKVEKLRYEMPGRIFHELMPSKIRKLLAAFYTRPQAAEILANLIIERSDDTVLDPACGSGTILTATYRRKLELFEAEKRKETHTNNFARKTFSE